MEQISLTSNNSPVKAKRIVRKTSITIAALLIIVLIYFFVARFLGPVGFEQKKDLIDLVAKLVGGLVLMIGVYFTWRRSAAAEKAVVATEKAVLATEKTILVTQESQITDRFTKAIGQLGSDNLAIRLGGIYSLERIAKDSEKDHGPIMEVLTAFVRENSPWNADDNTKIIPKPKTDIQAIVTVLGRRKTDYPRWQRQNLDLSNTDLRKFDFTEGNFARTIFNGSNLERATFRSSFLGSSVFRRAILHNARFTNAQFSGARFVLASLRRVTLKIKPGDRVSLLGADLERATLAGDFRECTGLKPEQISKARLHRVPLLPAYLEQPLLGPAPEETEESLDENDSE